jgi:hypothetical protein
MARVDEARKAAHELLDALEVGDAAIDICLMKAARLARLMRDSDAKAWIELETRGYPEKFVATSLGSCHKYAVAGGRILPDGKYYLLSLPGFEAMWKADQAHVEAIRVSPLSATHVKDFLEKNATEALMGSQIKLQSARKEAFVESQGRFFSLKSALHSYATDAFIAIEFGDIAEDIFNGARSEVDAFVRAHCPKAAEHLLSINERLRDASSESRSLALTSCRRLLVTVADSVFPAQTDPWKDSKGQLRSVGPEEYKNRLLAYIESRLQSVGSLLLETKEMEHLAAKLDALNEKASKGVHSDVSEAEARLAVIQTYLFVAEVARLSPTSTG